MTRITPNLLNQYTSRTVSGAVDVMGIALGTNTVTVDGQAPYRKGEYFRKELSLDSLAAVWKPVNVVAPGEPSIARYEFVAKTNEFFYHDLDGNLTSDGRWTYTWDAENRLIRMVANSGVGPQIRIDFEYDWMSRRIAKKVWDNPAGTGSPTNSLKFVYDGWNLIAVLSPQSTVLRSFTWGLDLSGSLQGAGGVGGLLAVSFPGTQGAQTTNCFVAFDGNGNVAGLVNADGKQVAQYEYGPFGEVIRATGPMAKANPFRFSTKYQDDETDLLYYGYRYYNASTGRWLSKDPIMEAGSINLYAFLLNDPADDVDLFGLLCQRDRFEFELGKFMKWIPFQGEKEVGNAWIRAEWSRCDKCCKDGVKTRHKWDVAVGASGTGPKVRPFTAIGLPFVYVRIVFSGNGAVSVVREPCPKSWSGGGCVTVMIGVRVGLDDTLPGWLDIYGEGGGGCRICLKASQLEDRARVTMACSVYGRVGVRVGAGRFRYTHMWEIRASTDEDDIFSF